MTFILLPYYPEKNKFTVFEDALGIIFIVPGTHIS